MAKKTCKAEFDPKGKQPPFVCTMDVDHDGPTHTDGEHVWGDPTLPMPMTVPDLPK